MSQPYPIQWRASLISDDYQFGEPIVRISNKLYESLGLTDTSWVKIKSQINGETVYRIPKRSTAETSDYFYDEFIIIDYQAAIKLCSIKDSDNNDIAKQDGVTHLGYTDKNKPNTLYEVDWTIRRVNKPETLIAYWKHPYASYRFSIKLAFFSVLLGLLGLVSGIASCCAR